MDGALFSVRMCLPVQTPLGERWNHLIPLNKRYTPQMILHMAAKRNQNVGLARLDLHQFCQSVLFSVRLDWSLISPIHRSTTIRTNSRGTVLSIARSYRRQSSSLWQGSCEMQIRCQGHGATPSPEAVNEFWWTVSQFERRKTNRFILVHCTHGFNRTGMCPTPSRML